METPFLCTMTGQNIINQSVTKRGLLGTSTLNVFRGQKSGRYARIKSLDFES